MRLQSELQIEQLFLFGSAERLRLSAARVQSDVDRQWDLGDPVGLILEL